MNYLGIDLIINVENHKISGVQRRPKEMERCARLMDQKALLNISSPQIGLQSKQNPNKILWKKKKHRAKDS